MAGTQRDTRPGNRREAAGKQPIAPVLARAMTMLNLLPQKPPGLTAQQIRDALAEMDDGFDVHTRTVERNLSDLSSYFPIVADEDVEPFRWRWMDRANAQLQRMVQRVAAAGTERPSLPGADSALSWQPAEAYAQALNVPVADVIRDLSKGKLNGVLLHGRWYVLDLVRLELDPDHPELARLRISANRAGSRLTAGTAVLELQLSYDGNAVSDAISPFVSDPDRAPPEWTPVRLGDTTFEVHRSLQGDLLGALIEWMAEVELGDLLDQYPPDPTP